MCIRKPPEDVIICEVIIGRVFFFCSFVENSRVGGAGGGGRRRRERERGAAWVTDMIKTIMLLDCTEIWGRSNQF